MSDLLRQLYELVQPSLPEGITDFGLEERGWILGRGTARASVDVLERGERLFVTVTIPLAEEVPASAKLFEHVATNADRFLFGHLSCDPTGRDTVVVSLTHTLLADHLQLGEVLACLDEMLHTADTWDGLLVRSFGGRHLVS